MIELGINLIPDMPCEEVVETIRVAEDIGYTISLLADEGFMPDVYAILGNAASRTSRIRLGPVTNGYTRHPAVTAVAMATLNELSGGRAIATLVAGGSIVLNPMGIPLEAPLTVMRETIEIMRLLWSGEAVTWQGKRYHLKDAKMSMREQQIPLWMAVRGDRMLQLAGELSDGVVLMFQSDLGAAIDIVESGRKEDKPKPQRIFLERLAYTPEMLAKATNFYAHVVMDMPERQLRSMLTDDEIVWLKGAYKEGGSAAMTRLITPGIIRRYKVAGTPEECRRTMGRLIREHALDVFLLNITQGGLEANIRLMKDTYDIVSGAEKEIS